jgi:4'-phosphopantetheinyl transferase
VHLWRVELDVGADAEERLREELAADELARAEGFASTRARSRFVVGRGTLRVLLGDLLGERPLSVSIEEGASGKPRLAAHRLGFNVSHSGDLALICIAEGFEVGVDLEQLRPVPSAAEIARRRFAPAEARFVGEGGESDIDRRFLLCWTRKEAVAKAIGAGLSFDLRGFAVPLEEPGGVVSFAGPAGGPARRWQVLDVPLGDEHIAALALPASAMDTPVTVPPSPTLTAASVQLDHCTEIDIRSY